MDRSWKAKISIKWTLILPQSWDIFTDAFVRCSHKCSVPSTQFVDRGSAGVWMLKSNFLHQVNAHTAAMMGCFHGCNHGLVSQLERVQYALRWHLTAISRCADAQKFSIQWTLILRQWWAVCTNAIMGCSHYCSVPVTPFGDTLRRSAGVRIGGQKQDFLVKWTLILRWWDFFQGCKHGLFPQL